MLQVCGWDFRDIDCIGTMSEVDVYVVGITYMHAYIHACMHTYIHTYIQTYIHTHIQTYNTSRLSA